MPEKPREELWVALAGPAVNVVIAAGLFLWNSATARPDFHQLSLLSGSFVERLIGANLWLAGFNLIPAFPMDGGRVLRALLGTRMDHVRATLTASHVGQALALVFGLIGLFAANPFLVFIALFVWMGAEAEASTVQVRTLGGVPVQRVMLTEFRTLQPDDTLANAVNHVLAGFQHDFPVVFGDHVLGILTREDLMKALAQRGSEVHLREVMRRDVPAVDSHDMLERALPVLRSSGLRSIPVEHDDRLVGMLDLENVAEFLTVQSALRRSQRDGKEAGQQSKNRPAVMP
jgi:CBS domain-containing protein